MLIFSQVSIALGGRKLLNHASFEIAAGDKVVIRGRSGCGKTTLLKCILGAVRPESGTIMVNNLAVRPENINTIRQQVAYVGQEPILSCETAGEDLLLPFSFKANREARPSQERISAVLQELQLAPTLLDQKSASLSGGEKQRLAIARAILMGKKIFLADEITSALDQASKTAVLDFLFAGAHTVVSVSHDPDWIARCSRRFTLTDNRLQEDE